MLNFAKETARQAGLILLEKYGRAQLEITDKGEKNIVTEADLAAEKYIVDAIKNRFPAHAILAEESGASVVEGDYEYRWIIDPLDGTTNFSHAYPCFCVSIGLEYKGELHIGAIYDPTRDEMFAAEKGNGATLNNKRIKVSQVDDLGRALLVTGFPYDVRKREVFVDLFSKFVLNAQGVRRDGSAAIDLAYVACGRFDGFWEDGLNAWDTSAGVLFVREAGGIVTHYDNTPFDIHKPQMLASNGLLHQKMLEVLHS